MQAAIAQIAPCNAEGPICLRAMGICSPSRQIRVHIQPNMTEPAQQDSAVDVASFAWVLAGKFALSMHNAATPAVLLDLSACVRG